MVNVQGQSLVTGNEAFKKAAEVSALVESLGNAGVPGDAIRLVDVTADIESGLLLKSSSANYLLLIVCTNLENLGGVLSVIAGRKNAQLHTILWDYDHLDDIKRKVLHSATQKGMLAAKAIAESLEVQLLGVHRLSYDISGLDTDRDFGLSQGAFGSRKRKDAHAL